MPRPISHSLPLSRASLAALKTSRRAGQRASALPFAQQSTIGSSSPKSPAASKNLWRHIADAYGFLVAVIQNLFIACLKAVTAFFTGSGGPFQSSLENQRALALEHLQAKLVTAEDLVREFLQTDGQNLSGWTAEERDKLYLAIGKARQLKRAEKAQAEILRQKEEEEKRRAEALKAADALKQEKTWGAWLKGKTKQAAGDFVQAAQKSVQTGVDLGVRGVRWASGTDYSLPQTDETYIKWGRNFISSAQGALEERIEENGLLEAITEAIKAILESRPAADSEKAVPVSLAQGPSEGLPSPRQRQGARLPKAKRD
ncbi:MAG: hypothetical protein WC371_02070 [Parachlamydiales bacterium]